MRRRSIVRLREKTRMRTVRGLICLLICQTDIFTDIYGREEKNVYF